MEAWELVSLVVVLVEFPFQWVLEEVACSWLVELRVTAQIPTLQSPHHLEDCSSLHLLLSVEVEVVSYLLHLLLSLWFLWSHGYCMGCCCFHWNLYLERHWCWFDLMAETVHLAGDWDDVHVQPQTAMAALVSTPVAVQTQVWCPQKCLWKMTGPVLMCTTD